MSRKRYVDTNISLSNADPVIKAFLDVQSVNTRKTYDCFMRKILEFTKSETGSKMLKESKQWTQRIFAFQQWLLGQGYSPKYVTSCCGCLRGFFTHNRKTLDLNKSERAKLKKTSRNSEDYLLDKVDIQKMANVGNLKEKYVLLAGASFGLRAEDFTAEFTYGKLRLAIQKGEENHIEPPIPIGKTKTQKESVLAFPFISTDALPIIKAILDGHTDAKDTDRIWTERPTQLTVVLQNLAKKSGIEPHEQRIRFHCLRKYLCDRLSPVASESKWKQIVGKKISEGEYVSDLELREVYAKALPSICINVNGNEIKAKITRQTIEINELSSTVKAQDDLTRLQQERIQTLENEIQRMKQDGLDVAKQLTDFMKNVKEGKLVVEEPKRE